MFNSQHTISTVTVGILIWIALAFAIPAYVSWSSDTAVAEFMRTASASVLDHSNQSLSSVQQGRTGCPVGKRQLPTEIKPLP